MFSGTTEFSSNINKSSSPTRSAKTPPPPKQAFLLLLKGPSPGLAPELGHEGQVASRKPTGQRNKERLRFDVTSEQVGGLGWGGGGGGDEPSSVFRRTIT